MKKAKVLYGTDELAKGSFATRIADSYKNVAIVDLTDTRLKKHLQPYDFVDQLSPETDLIIYLNVPTGYPFEYFFSMIPDGFLVNQKNKALFQINPDLVIVTDKKPELAGYSYELRFELIEFEAEPMQKEKFIEPLSSGIVINLTPWRKISTRYLHIQYGWLRFKILPF